MWSGPFSNARGSPLAEFLAGWDFVTLNDPLLGPTFSTTNGSSWIDISAVSGPFATTCSHWCLDRLSIPSSDHALVSFNIRTDHTRILAPDDPMRRLNTFVPGDSTDWPRFHYLLTSAISNLDAAFANQPSPAEIDAIVRTFAAHIHGASSHTMRARTVKAPSSSPWWSQDLDSMKQSLSARSRALRRLRSSRGRDDPTTLTAARLVSQLRAKYRRAIRSAKRKSWEKLLSECSDSPWNFIYKIAFRKIRPDHMWSAIKSTQLQPICTDLPDTVDLYIRTLFPRAPPDSSPNGFAASSSSLTAREPDFTLDEILIATAAIKPKKAPGMDGICGETTRRVLLGHTSTCRRIFNLCLANGHFPLPWKEGSLCLILKDPDLPADSVKSFRPITLLPVFGKVLERLINYRLRQDIAGPDFSSPRQFGFVQGRSSVDALMSLRQFVSAF